MLLLPAVLFLGGWFLVPLGQLLLLSFSSSKGTFAAYTELVNDPVYREVFVNTLILAINVTVLCVVLAYPSAYVLSRLRGTLLTLAIYCVLFPFWISVLVRTYSWMLLLASNGPVNRVLQATGLLAHPLQLLFNNTGVYIGMVHVLLPYALLPIYAAMQRVDRQLLLASEGLGAPAWMTFVRVYLPLTMPGVTAAAIFVFLIALGFFITPALLGSIHNLTVAMLIDLFVSERLVWSLAAAASFILLLLILSLLLALSRFVTFGRLLVQR